MSKQIASLSFRVARRVMLLVGLAVTLALVLGTATVALASVPGDPFKLGRVNTINALTSLVGSVNNAMLKVDNNSTGASATALDLRVESGKAPMKINSQTKVSNLNVDLLDGKNSDEFLGGNVKVRYGQSTVVPPSGPVARGSYAFCEPGEKLLSGGHTVVDDPNNPPAPNQSAAWDTFTIEGGPVTEGFGAKVPIDGRSPIGWARGGQERLRPRGKQERDSSGLRHLLLLTSAQRPDLDDPRANRR
jgi:hypothetical protein